jgi:hypothetical protein
MQFTAWEDQFTPGFVINSFVWDLGVEYAIPTIPNFRFSGFAFKVLMEERLEDLKIQCLASESSQ